MADRAPRRGSLPMSGARLTAGLECANDVGVRFTLWPSGDSQGPSRVSTGGAVSCASVARTAGAARAAPAVAGATPPSGCLVRHRGGLTCARTCHPSPAGSLPARYPSGKGFQRRCQAADHPVRRPSSRCVGATAKDPGGELGTGPTVGGTAPATGNGGP